MLSVDELTQIRWRQEEQRESADDRRLRLLADNMRNAEVTVSRESGRDITSLQDQLGRSFTPQQFMEKLRKCNPKLTFLKHPSEDLYGVYVLNPNGTCPLPTGEMATHICGMPASIVPEFTVVEEMDTQFPNPDLFNKKVNRQDVDWIKRKTIKQILLQGWRTILYRLLAARLISEYDVTTHFGWIPTHQSKKWHDLTK